jgi:hypothetical protein
MWVLKIAPDGSPILDDPPASSSRAARLSSDFEGTLFQSALDASEGRAWARDSGEGVAEGWWSTQGRHLDITARIVGVATDLSDRLRETLAHLLEVDLLLLQETKGSLPPSRGYRRTGEAIRHVLAALRTGTWRAAALLMCGHLVGRWGEPHYWCPQRRCFDRMPFRLLDTVAPP